MVKEHSKAAVGGGGSVRIDDGSDLELVDDSYEASGVPRVRTRLGVRRRGGGGGGGDVTSRYLPPSDDYQLTDELSSYGNTGQDLGAYTG